MSVLSHCSFVGSVLNQTFHSSLEQCTFEIFRSLDEYADVYGYNNQIEDCI